VRDGITTAIGKETKEQVMAPRKLNIALIGQGFMIEIGVGNLF
jgi:hypothetical protein